ncbi:hypothetical protein BBJ28_00014669 [Nothophytophthora sp. Chile5]|nr:hypothetical protein BBJ28_00014669 [Nothophytophthora sp. Chile5]
MPHSRIWRTEAMADEAFLEEVAGFLDLFDLSPLPTTLVGADDGLPAPTSSEAVTASTFIADPDGAVPSDRKKTKSKRLKPKRDDTSCAREIQKAKDRKRRNEYRAQQKLERESLQCRVGELSAELDQVRSTKAITGEGKDDLELPVSVWQTIAMQQRDVRLASEAQQRQLQTSVGVRAALIEELGGLVRKRLNGGELVENLGLDNASYRQKRVQLEPTDTAIFETYLCGLNSAYAETDEVFRACGMDAMPDDAVNSKQRWEPDVKVGCFQSAMKQMMPFNFKQTCQSLWQLAYLLHRQEDRELYYGLGDPDNTVAFKFRITSRQTSGRIVSVVQRTVVRRFVASDRMVITWRSFTEGEGLFAGMHYDETGWCAVKPSATPLAAGATIETYIRIAPMHFDCMAPPGPAVEQFTDLVLHAETEDTTVVMEQLEKLLLTNA